MLYRMPSHPEIDHETSSNASNDEVEASRDMGNNERGTSNNMSNDEGSGDLQVPANTQHQNNSEMGGPTHQRSCWRCMSTISDRNPRMIATVCGIFLPLWLLVCLAILCGYFLARLEAPIELDSNDRILANRFSLELFGADKAIDKCLGLPKACFEEYMSRKYIESSNITLGQFVSLPTSHLGAGSEEQKTVWLETLSEAVFKMGDFIRECSAEAEDAIEELQTIQEQIGLEVAIQTLSFNWIRCWNESELDLYLIFSPTAEQLAAADNQDEFYQEAWVQDRKRLYREYLDELGDDHPDSRLQATIRSIADATGSRHCSENVSGTAWFWFTVMTTVGYGNQAPVTSGGRAMVSSLGFVSILAFGGIAATAGSIVNILFDDMVARCNLSILSNPIAGCCLWGGITAAWIFHIANMSFAWWQRRMDEVYATRWESGWFAYISTTTTGLGDFFYQPEVIFFGDLFSFTFLFLIGFVFFATLLGELADLWNGLFPDSTENLKHRVQRTNLLNMRVNEEEADTSGESSTTLELLRDVAGHEENNHDGTKSMSIILEEEELLKRLLEQKTSERLRIENDEDS